eukprot:PhM_4_TR11535/c0_g1_i1/m.36929
MSVNTLGGILKVDVSRGKALYFDPMETAAIAPAIRVTLSPPPEGSGETVMSEPKDGTDVFWHYGKEFEIPAAENPCKVFFEVVDTSRTPNVVLGIAEWEKMLSEASVLKGEAFTLNLAPAPGAPPDPDAPSNIGSISGKLTFKQNKPEKEAPKDPNADVVLATRPPVNGIDPLAATMPENLSNVAPASTTPRQQPSGLYLWLRIIRDAKWRNSFFMGIIAFVNTKGPQPKKPDPVVTLDDVIKKRWKMNRRHMIMTRLRYLAELNVTNLSATYETFLTPELELSRKTAWKERTCMREDLIIPTSQRIAPQLETLWFNYKLGTTITPSVESRFSVDQTFDAQHYATVTALLFVHMLGLKELTIETGRAVGLEDYQWMEEEIKEKKLSNMSLFNHLVLSHALFWCESVTEVEILEFLKTLTPIFVQGKKLHNEAMAAAAEAAKKLNQTARRR